MKKLFVIMVAALAFVACQEEKKAEPTVEERMETYMNDIYEAAESQDYADFIDLTTELQKYLKDLSEEDVEKANAAAENWREENAEKWQVIEDIL